MSDVDEKLNEIRERHRKDARWHCGPSMICPQSHEDRGWLLNEIERLRADLLEQASLLGMGAEREAKLRARVEVLERVLHGAVAESHNFVKRVIKEAKP